MKTFDHFIGKSVTIFQISVILDMQVRIHLFGQLKLRLNGRQVPTWGIHGLPLWLDTCNEIVIVIAQSTGVMINRILG